MPIKLVINIQKVLKGSFQVVMSVFAFLITLCSYILSRNIVQCRRLEKWESLLCKQWEFESNTNDTGLYLPSRKLNYSLEENALTNVIFRIVPFLTRN